MIPDVKNLALSTISISDVHEQISINLDEMFDSIYFIPLQTNEKVVLRENRNTILINRNVLIIIDGHSAMLFDKQGRFIRKILTWGRGPKEFNSIRSPRLTNYGIYYNDGQYRDRICFYEFESDSLKFIPHTEGHISNFVIDNNKVLHYLWCGPFFKDHFEAILFSQNMDGIILREKHFGKVHKSEGVLGFHKFYYRNNKIFLSTPRVDTIWEIKDSALIHVWTTDIGDPSKPEINTQTYYNAELIEFSDANILFNLQQFKKVGKRNTGGKRELIYAIRDTHKVGIVSSFVLDDFSISPEFIRIHSQSTSHIVFEMSAYKFIDEFNKQKLSDTGKYSKFLFDLKQSMHENDNSLLIVGVISDNLDVY